MSTDEWRSDILLNCFLKVNQKVLYDFVENTLFQQIFSIHGSEVPQFFLLTKKREGNGTSQAQRNTEHWKLCHLSTVIFFYRSLFSYSFNMFQCMGGQFFLIQKWSLGSLQWWYDDFWGLSITWISGCVIAVIGVWVCLGGVFVNGSYNDKSPLKH